MFAFHKRILYEIIEYFNRYRLFFKIFFKKIFGVEKNLSLCNLLIKNVKKIKQKIKK